MVALAVGPGYRSDDREAELPSVVAVDVSRKRPIFHLRIVAEFHQLERRTIVDRRWAR